MQMKFIAKRTLDAHFGEQGSVIYKILNPDDESTPPSRLRKQLQHELDEDREGTGFQKLKKRARLFDGRKIICSVSKEDTQLPLEIAYKVARFELVASTKTEGGRSMSTNLRPRSRTFRDNWTTLEL
jgi:hypothetical protein